MRREHHVVQGLEHVRHLRFVIENALGRPLARYDRSIDVHISSIRHKLGPRNDKMLRAVATGRGNHQKVRLCRQRLRRFMPGVAAVVTRLAVVIADDDVECSRTSGDRQTFRSQADDPQALACQ